MVKFMPYFEVYYVLQVARVTSSVIIVFDVRYIN